MHLFDLKRVKWPPRNQNPFTCLSCFDEFFRTHVATRTSAKPIQNTGTETFMNKMWKKLEAPTWEGTIFAVRAWEQTVYSRLPPQESQGVTGELHLSCTNASQGSIRTTSFQWNLHFDCGCGWGGRFLTRHAFCKSPPNLVSHSAVFDRPTPAWHYSIAGAKTQVTVGARTTNPKPQSVSMRHH